MKRTGSTVSSGGSGMGLSRGSHNSLETLQLREVAEVEAKLLATLTDVLTDLALAEEVVEHAMMLEYVANLCSTLRIDNDFSQKSWAPCVTPYLAAFLPPDEAAVATELFRSKSSKLVRRGPLQREATEKAARNWLLLLLLRAAYTFCLVMRTTHIWLLLAAHPVCLAMLTAHKPWLRPGLFSSSFTTVHHPRFCHRQSLPPPQAESDRMAKYGLAAEEDMGPEVCNIYFSLAYGGKVLLHNTNLFLHRGKKYGLLGHNGAGKTTLLRNIANGKIEGMPKELVPVFVESHFDDEAVNDTPTLRVLLDDPMVASRKSPAEVETLLRTMLFFDDAKLQVRRPYFLLVPHVAYFSAPITQTHTHTPRICSQARKTALQRGVPVMPK